MRFQIFLAAVCVLALGYAGTEVLWDDTERTGFLIDALKLGGALLICGLFSLKLPLHGIIGAGVIAMIGAFFGAQHLAAVPKYWLRLERPEAVPLLSSAAAIICLLLLAATARYLLAERRRRQTEELLAEDDAS